MLKPVMRVLGHLVVLAVLAGLVGLGRWQLDRAAWKEGILRDHAQRSTAPAINLETLMTLSDKRYYPVNVVGHFLPREMVLIDNQFLNHQVGYRVLQLFQPQGRREAIVVERGWVPKSTSWSDFDTMNIEKVTIRAEVKPPPRFAPRFGPWRVGQAEHGWPIIVQTIDVRRIAHHFRRPVLDFLLRLRAGDAYALAPMTTLVTLPSAQHKSYALTWFGLALTLGSGYLWLCWRKP